MIAFFDCIGGISGDMTLGALVDLGVSAGWLQETLRESVGLKGFEIHSDRVQRHGISACSLKVSVKPGQKSRNYRDIQKLIDGSDLPAAVKSASLGMFKRLGEAEAAVHGCPLEEVHFHEVGAVDALVDIIGTALAVDHLGIQRVVASRVPVGSGFVDAHHGRLPVPAPATLALLQNVPVYGTGIAAELVTPTGAAIITSLADTFSEMPSMTVQRVGYGAGKRDLEQRPNLLRVIIGQPGEDKTTAGGSEADVVMVETCIDDMNPEIFGFLMDRLFEDGALDVYWIPIYMKKNRPATKVQVLCRRDATAAISDRILRETTTTGVRYYPVRRLTLQREQAVVTTTYGEVAVKRITGVDGQVRVVPEFDACRRIAVAQDLPIRIVFETILREIGSRSALDNRSDGL
ncbi:MAG: hypothetical protein AMJ54_14300 [Deltaproteobacteria bacterium SG8_13]|nr:MAG: hypothetical protein AMJ54_14300 [Deltaproteobacteria bacterium SG8_13]